MSGCEQRCIKQYAPTTCVLPLTSNLAGKKFPINVVLKTTESALKVDSLVLVAQIRTVAKERLIKKLSDLQPDKMLEVEMALKTFLDIRN